VLVLSRRSHESIRIGDTIVVTILEVHGDHVRIGIEAPRDVEVHRQEIYESIQEANVSAASPTPEVLAAAAATLGGLFGDGDERSRRSSRPGEHAAQAATGQAEADTSGTATS